MYDSECTFVMLKPDFVFEHSISKILDEMSSMGRIIASRMVRLTDTDATAFYSEHEGKPFYQELIKFTISGPIYCMVVEGDGIVNRVRQKMGSTNPKEALTGTWRRTYGKGMPNNAIHGSDSPESAWREILLATERRFI